jgi:hypothetical protein
MTGRKRHRLFDRDAVLLVVGLVGGGLIGWGISDVYYRKALHDSEATVAKQNKVQDFMFRGIESIGTINYVRDASGEVTGVNIQLRGSACDTTTATGTLTVGPGPSKK